MNIVDYRDGKTIFDLEERFKQEVTKMSRSVIEENFNDGTN